MLGFPSREVVEYTRYKYPVGTRIRLISMEDPYRLSPGEMGTVMGVDDAGQIMMCWDCGRSLSLIPGVDSFAVVEEE